MKLLKLERMMGVEPTLPAWEAEVLPMNYIRVHVQYSIKPGKIQQEICRRLPRREKCAGLPLWDARTLFLYDPTAPATPRARGWLRGA